MRSTMPSLATTPLIWPPCRSSPLGLTSVGNDTTARARQPDRRGAFASWVVSDCVNGSRVDRVGVDNLNSARWVVSPRSRAYSRGTATASRKGETRGKQNESSIFQKRRTRCRLPLHNSMHKKYCFSPRHLTGSFVRCGPGPAKRRCAFIPAL